MKHNKILFNTDGADGSAGPDTSMFDQDYTQTDTSYPLLPAGVYDVEIVEVKVVPNSKQTGNNLIVKMKTTTDVRAAKTGDLLQAGFPQTHRVSLTPTEDYSKSSIDKAVGTFVQSFKDVPSEAARMRDLEWYVGKVTQVKATINPEKNGFPESNSFRFIPLKKTK